MTDIDYQALSKQTKLTPMSCRAVVAALRDQGLVVVRKASLQGLYDEALDCFSESDGAWRHQYHPNFVADVDSIRAALAAPGDGGESP